MLLLCACLCLDIHTLCKTVPCKPKEDHWNNFDLAPICGDTLWDGTVPRWVMYLIPVIEYLIILVRQNNVLCDHCNSRPTQQLIIT